MRPLRSRPGVAAGWLALAFACALAGRLGAAGLEETEIGFLSRRDGNWEVYLRCADGRELNLTRDPGEDYGFAWSPDGGRLAFASNRGGDRDLYVLDLSTGALANVTRHPAEDVQPDWSPDGARLAFVSDRNGDAEDRSLRTEIWVLELASGAARRLTRNELYEESPAWSPDGGRLAFSRTLAATDGGEAGDTELFAIGADGGGERRLTARPGFDSGPAWSPDGGRILFHGRAARSVDLLELDLASGAVRPLTVDDRDDWQPAYAAGGAILWCTGAPPHGLDIWAMAADGSGARRVVADPGRDEAPRARPPDARGGPCAEPAR